jgi:hypothetical protein
VSERIALTLAGRAGARLAAGLGVLTSDATLLRLIADPRASRARTRPRAQGARRR